MQDENRYINVYHLIPFSARKRLADFRYYIKSRYSKAVIIASGECKKSDSLLKKMHNRYEGKRCFILGNGPSLKAEDLDLIKDEYTFASNRIYKIFEQTDWRPSFFGMMDEEVAQSEGVIESINRIDCKVKFFLQEGWYAFHKAKGRKCYIHAWYGRKWLENPQFSEDLTKGVYCIATVTYMLLQVAAYLGFSEIYLLGVDNSYGIERDRNGRIIKKEGQKNYFGIQDDKEKKNVGASWESDIAFEYAEKYSRKHGFRIFNATRGGTLEAFERVQLEDIVS